MEGSLTCHVTVGHPSVETLTDRRKRSRGSRVGKVGAEWCLGTSLTVPSGGRGVGGALLQGCLLMLNSKLGTLGSNSGTPCMTPTKHSSRFISSSVIPVSKPVISVVETRFQLHYQMCVSLSGTQTLSAAQGPCADLMVCRDLSHLC